MKKLLLALIMLIGATMAVVAAFFAFLRRFLPQTEGHLALDGLNGPVEIVRDRWGVPHIYTANEEDLFFAQGYVHAQDRLWQMEIQRRAGAGRLAEVLGEPALEIDRTFRTLGLNRAAEAEAASLSGETLRVLQAYSAGINAYMRSQRGRLGVEFALLRFEPQPWRPVDSLYWAKVMAFTLSGNWTSEVLRARLVRQVGAELAATLEPVYPSANPVTVESAADETGTPRQPNGWRSDALVAALKTVEEILGSPPRPARPARRSGLSGVIDLNPAASNSWVVDGRHSATGQPLLANDTHMAVAMPGLWYQAHLSGGRYDVAGVTFPGTPGVVVGHNQQITWGLTTGWQDGQDLYLERANPDNPGEFEFQGRWEPAAVEREVILVKGREAPVVVEVLVTRHGPLVNGLVGETQPMTLRWVALENNNLLEAVIQYNRAQNWEEFRAALAHWSSPPHNFVYADTAGNVGFIQAGWTPVRSRGHGMVPVPGWSGDYEWGLYLTIDELPQALNPASGQIVVANNVVVGEHYPHFLSADTEDPVRAARIAELLASQETFTTADFNRFQRDTFSAHAQRFVRHLVKLQPTNSREAEVLEMMRQWDCCIDADSVGASIYEVCRLNLLHVIFDRHLGQHTAAYLGQDITGLGDFSIFQGRTAVRLLDMLDDPSDNEWLTDPVTGIPEARGEALHRALRQTLLQLKAELGDDMAAWSWGRLHQVQFAHVAGAVKPLDLLFNRGPFPMSGDNDTLLRATTAPSFPFKPVGGMDTLRFVADVSDWDRCQIMVASGQSGHVASPNYADRLTLWRSGLMLPMPYSRAAVDRSAAKRLTLNGKRPAAGSNGSGPR